MIYLKEPPNYSPCWFCKAKYKYEPFYVKDFEVQYSCPKHEELYVDWFCTRLSHEKWFFKKLFITMPGHFRLSWHINSNQIEMYEWSYLESVGHIWQLISSNPDPHGPFQLTTFDPSFILSKSTKQIASIFQLYKIFS
jgi:hypothetical protein